MGNLTLKGVLSKNIKVFAPAFIPVATAAKLVQEYYPVCPTIVAYMNSMEMTKVESVPYTFDEINLPPAFDFSPYVPTKSLLTSSLEKNIVTVGEISEYSS